MTRYLTLLLLAIAAASAHAGAANATAVTPDDGVRLMFTTLVEVVLVAGVAASVPFHQLSRARATAVCLFLLPSALFAAHNMFVLFSYVIK